MAEHTDTHTRAHGEQELAFCGSNFATRTRRRGRNKLKAIKLSDGEEFQIKAVLV